MSTPSSPFHYRIQSSFSIGVSFFLKPMMRLQLLQVFVKLHRSLEFLVVLALLSWSVTRYHSDVYFSHVSNFLLNPFVNFVIGNTIIMLLLYIYRKNDVGSNSGTNVLQYDYFHITEVPDCGETDAENQQTLRDIGDVVDVQNQLTVESIEETAAIDIDAHDNEQIVSLLENTVSQDRCDLVTKVKEKAHRLQRTKSELLDSEVLLLQRSKSELLNTEGRVRTRGKLRRSESEISSRAISSFETVDKLSNEEFKHTIEAYIAKHQRFLWSQKMND